MYMTMKTCRVRFGSSFYQTIQPSRSPHISLKNSTDQLRPELTLTSADDGERSVATGGQEERALLHRNSPREVVKACHWLVLTVGDRVVVLVRHGERIDDVQADWIASAERPFDPPLTEQGALQAFRTGEVT